MKKRNYIALFLALATSGSLYAKEPVATIEPAAKAVLEEAVAASGGRANIAKIKSRQVKGEILMPAQGLKMTMLTTLKAPSKSHTKMEIPGLMTVEQGFDGTTAWSKDSIQGLRELKGPELDQAKESAALFPELEILDNLTSAKLLVDVEEDGKTLKSIQVTTKDDKAKTLYFDSATKLLTKMTFNVATGPGGQMDVTAVMSDYKEQDGVKYASKMKMNVMGQEMQMNFIEVTHNVEVDDAIFVMPK